MAKKQTAADCRLSRRLVGDCDDFVAVKVPRVAELLAASVTAGALFDRYPDCGVVYVNVMDAGMEAHVVAFLPPWPQSEADAYHIVAFSLVEVLHHVFLSGARNQRDDI